MDSFVEQLVVKPMTLADQAKKFGLIAATGILCLGLAYLSVMVMPLILLVVCAVAYGGYFLVTGMNVEYEYSVTNGELDVDKIIAKRKRKHMLTVRIAEFETFGLESEAKFDNNITTFLVGDGDEARYYAADFQHEGMGLVRLVFSPNERILEAIRPSLKRGLR